MSAVIHLDQPHPYFTNLDVLTGKVLVHLSSETSISGIQVKLEGESKTRLSGPRYGSDDPSDRRRTEHEVHKILYNVVTVFPTPGIARSGSASNYTFAAGTYEYPFSFKFPFNNACSTHNSMMTNMNISGFKVTVARDSHRHVKRTLPPSLIGFPGEAEIKYYVKATVTRPQFYKENIRAFEDLSFLPIEPPRTSSLQEEAYARRHYHFSRAGNPLVKVRGMKGLFSKTSSMIQQDVGEPPRVLVDARLPNPPILTCNEPIPLRVLVKKESHTPSIIFLQMLQIELLAYTIIRAQDLERTESSCSVILTRSNMTVPLGRASDAAGTEWFLDSSLWSRIPLPSSLPPSFETCNISRTYRLDVRVGLSYGGIGDIKSQLIVLPLTLPVKVYSGIAPPKALLDAMAASAKPSSTSSEAPTSGDNARPLVPPRPARAHVVDNFDKNDEDAPPSYEDAMAETLSPVDGPRREYNPPAASTSRSSEAEYGTNTRNPVDSGKGRLRSSLSNMHIANSSSESFDLLPSTPPGNHSCSPQTSPVAYSLAAADIKNHGGSGVSADEAIPPQYQAIGAGQFLGRENNAERHPSASAMDLGVPSRKPLPRTQHSGGP